MSESTGQARHHARRPAEGTEVRPMKKNPVIIVLATAAALGATCFIVLYLASLLISGKSSPTISPLPGGDRVALMKVEGVLIASERIVNEINDYYKVSPVKAIFLSNDPP